MNQYFADAVDRQKELNREEFLSLFCPRLRQLDADDRMRVIVYGGKQKGILHKFKGNPKGLMLWALDRQGYFDKLAKELGIKLPEEHG